MMIEKWQDSLLCVRLGKWQPQLELSGLEDLHFNEIKKKVTWWIYTWRIDPKRACQCVQSWELKCKWVCLNCHSRLFMKKVTEKSILPWFKWKRASMGSYEQIVHGSGCLWAGPDWRFERWPEIFGFALFPSCGGLVFRAAAPSGGRMATAAPNRSACSSMYIMISITSHTVWVAFPLCRVSFNKFLILMLNVLVFFSFS